MIQHHSMGTLAPEFGWLPSPRYLLRRSRVMALMKRFQPNSHGVETLEIGCGAGALLVDLAKEGFRPSAWEHSPQARNVAHQITQNQITIYSESNAPPKESFQWVLALEVLEHLENDAEALQQWKQLLNCQGYLLISAPAHKRKWGITDEWAGHYRRYEKEALTGLVEAQGLRVLHCENYGFPLANLLEPIRNQSLRRKRDHLNQTAVNHQVRTFQSGVEREELLGFQKLYGLPFGLPQFIAVCDQIQQHFAHKDWGNGYLVLAQKPSA